MEQPIKKKQIFLLCQISPSASSTRDLGTRLGKTQAHNVANLTCLVPYMSMSDTAPLEDKQQEMLHRVC